VPRVVAVVVVVDPDDEAALVDDVLARPAAAVDVIPWIDGEGFGAPIRRPVGVAR
jgi:hypothetical protein